MQHTNPIQSNPILYHVFRKGHNMNTLRYRSLLVAAIAVCVALASPTDSHAAKKLRWKFRAGEKYLLDIVQTMEMVMTVQDNKNHMKFNIAAKMLWDVKKVSDDGVATIAFTIDRMIMEMDAKGLENIRQGLAIKNVLDSVNGEKVIRLIPEHYNTVHKAVEGSSWLPEAAQKFIPFYDAINGAQNVPTPADKKKSK